MIITTIRGFDIFKFDYGSHDQTPNVLKCSNGKSVKYTVFDAF